MTGTTLGAICNQVGTWPHDKLKEAMKDLYGFASDYPGIRHGGTPANALRARRHARHGGHVHPARRFTPYLSARSTPTSCIEELTTMQQQNIPIGTLVDMYKRGEMRLPEIQRHYVWRATRVRDLLDSLYRGYPSGSILMWETDEPIPTRDFAIAQDSTAFAGRKLLLDGQQRLTSLTAVLNGEPISVRGRKRPIDILFNLEHPEGPPSEATDVESDEDSPVTPDDEIADESEEVEDGEQGIQEKLSRRTFVVASRNLLSQPQWVSVSEVFRTANDAELLETGRDRIVQGPALPEVLRPAEEASRDQAVFLRGPRAGTRDELRGGDRDLRARELAGREATSSISRWRR